MNLDTYIAKQKYEKKSELGKFWHAIKFSYRSGGLWFVGKYLICWVILKRKVKKWEKNCK